MRLAVGLGALGIGVIALGWWGQVQYAPFMQAWVDAGAQRVVAGSIHGASVQVAGRDITLTGIADGAAERDRLLTGLNAVSGRRVVRDALQVLPLVEPFTLTAQAVDGVIHAVGHAPTQPVRDALARAASGPLTLAAGAPDAGWGDAAMLGLAALAVLETGDLTIEDRALMLSGVLLTRDAEAPLRAAMTALPDGYSITYDLQFIDDGTPPAYTLVYDAGRGARLEGKLPVGVRADDITRALGLAEIDNAATVAQAGEAGAISPVLVGVAPWLGEVETLQVAVSPAGTRVEVGFGAGADMELLGAALGSDLARVAQGLTLRLREVAAEGEEGTIRRNVATGREEVLTGGFWLPLLAVIPDAASCATEVDATLSANRIGFVTGSARLDARARAAVNALAGILGPCLRAAGLRAEIGGHTDATGSDEANQSLSQARAEAVRDALVIRGVPDAGLGAAGYGATEPVADNATEDGRAANRRTAVRWIE